MIGCIGHVISNKYWDIVHLQHQIRQEIIVVQNAALKLKQPNLD